MDGATLTIRFQDDSSPGANGLSSTPLVGQEQLSEAQQLVLQQQAAITAAGGVRGSITEGTTTASASIAQPTAPTVVQQPVPAAVVQTQTTTQQGGDPLGLAIQQIVGADPRATAAEIAKLLGGGITERQVQGYISQGQQVVQPASVQPAITSPVQPEIGFAPDIVSDTKAMWEKEAIERDRQSRAEDEARRQSDLDYLDSLRKPPPPPVTPPPVQFKTPKEQEAPDTSGMAQASVSAISHLAHMGGPLGSAAASVANATAAVPGVAAAAGSVLPGLAAAAPYIALASATLAVPAAALYTMESIAQTARGQAQGFSPALAGAEALVNVRQILANQRTASILGDELAEFATQRSRFNTAAQGTRDRLFEGALNDFNSAAKNFTYIAEQLEKLTGANPDTTREFGRLGSRVLLSALSPVFGTLYGALVETGKTIENKEILKDSNPLTYWLNRPPVKLPAPFEETGENVNPKMADFGGGLPAGLGF